MIAKPARGPAVQSAIHPIVPAESGMRRPPDPRPRPAARAIPRSRRHRPPEPSEGDQPPDDEDAGEDDDVASSDDPDASESAATKVPLDEINRYVGVYNAVKEAYVDPVDDNKLMGSAIRACCWTWTRTAPTWTRKTPRRSTRTPAAPMTASAWRCSNCPTARSRSSRRSTTRPRARRDQVRRHHHRRRRQAADAGQDERAAARQARQHGQADHRARGHAKPLDVSVKRETIHVASVRGRMLEPGYGYVRVSASRPTPRRISRRR